MNVVVGSILILLGLEDMRNQKLSVWILSGLILAGAVYGICENSFLHCVLGILPGAFLVVLAFLQKNVIGMGDAMTAVAYGLVYGWRITSLWLMFSFLLAAVIGLFFRLFCKQRAVQMPFIPFMAVVHAGMCL